MLYMMPTRIFILEPLKEKSFKEIAAIYIYTNISVKMSDTVSETSSDMSRHCCKCDLNDSIGYVRSVTKDCRVL